MEMSELKIVKLNVCRICNNSHDNTTWQVREMNLGTRDTFTYFQCSRCHSLQIEDVPDDLSSYYSSASGYYSCAGDPSDDSQSGIKKLALRLRDRYAIFDKGIMGKYLFAKYPRYDMRALSQCILTDATRILDVGCGSALLLYSLKKLGFRNLLGIDAYIDADIDYDKGLKILKKTIHEIEGEWDLIMFHHCFEHVADPLETLKCVWQLLSDGGICLIRVPVVPSYAWERYQTDWAQLDPPRHIFLHSVESLNILAQQADFDIEKIVYDSTDFQFWASEQYAKDIPLMSDRSYMVDPERSIFRTAQIAAFSREAKQLNKKRQGDQAAFYLRKK